VNGAADAATGHKHFIRGIHDGVIAAFGDIALNQMDGHGR
jgi:hypothetical protein